MRIGAEARLKSIFDDGTWRDVAARRGAADPLKFRDEQRYADRLKDAPRQDRARRRGQGRPSARSTAMPVVIGVQDFDFMGGSLGMAAGEAVITGLETAVDRERAVHRVRRLRRRAHAGGHPLADADAAHHRRGADAARGRAALHRRADQSDHRRRDRLLRHAGRRAYRRARRADRLRRPAGDRADDPREAAGRLPARRVSARARHGRHGRPPPQAARRWRSLRC